MQLAGIPKGSAECSLQIGRDCSSVDQAGQGQAISVEEEDRNQFEYSFPFADKQDFRNAMDCESLISNNNSTHVVVYPKAFDEATSME